MRGRCATHDQEEYMRPDRRQAIAFLAAAASTAPHLQSANKALAQASPKTSQLGPHPLPPSTGWTRALPQGPDARVKITEATPRTLRATLISGLGRWSTSS